MKAPRRNAPVMAMLLLTLAASIAGAPAGARAGEPSEESPANAPALSDARIIFLHHSTGECIWNGGVTRWFDAYNAANDTNHRISERSFPEGDPYGWENYPYDYWNIWVRHAGPRTYQNEPTLEMLTRQYDVIVFKHCFPVSSIEPDTGRPDVASRDKRLENYKLQYEALKRKMHRFPKTRFIVWTGAALVRGDTDQATARRAKAFFDWVKTDWDQAGDNVYVWDFHQLETGGGLYLQLGHAQGAGDSHPNETFSRTAAPYFCQRVMDVVNGRGDLADVTGRGSPAQPGPATPTPPTPVVPEPAPPEPAPVEPGNEPEPPDEPERAEPAEPAPVTSPTGPGTWVFDNAEDPDRRASHWGTQARYVGAADGHVVRIDFTAGKQEDWGEYGKHRVVQTLPPATDHDVTPFRYLALRVKADRELLIPLSLITVPPRRGEADQPHFGFSAYLDLKPGPWTWVVLDLTKLELEVEGPAAYERAGKPTRPMKLTSLRLCAHEKHEDAEVLVDDITFLRDLPENLAPHLRDP